MEEEIQTKPKLTRVAGVLCLLSFLALLAFVGLLFTPYNGPCLIALIISPLLAVISFIISLISHKESNKKWWIGFCVIDVTLFISIFFIAPLAGAKLLFSGIGNDAVSRAQEKAKIEYVKGAMPSKNLTLHNDETEDFDYRCFDDDGKIAEQFMNMEFTLVCNSSCYGMSETYFSLADDVTVRFSSDYDGIVIHAMYGTFWGYGEAYKSYSVDPIEGNKIHQMIDAKVNEQKTTYINRENEVKADTTLKGALDSMNENNPEFNITLIDPSYEVGLTRQKDDDKELLAALYELDETTFTEYSGKKVTYSYGFHYNALKSCPYWLYYYSTERVLHIERAYDGPYGGTLKLDIYYSLSEADGDHLMEIATKVVHEKEAQQAQE